MSVIAKMYALNAPRIFAVEQQVDLTCVCDDRLFTINTPVPGRVSENETFNTASPSGDCRFHLPKDVLIRHREEFYLIFHKQPECPAYEGALMVSKVRCSSITEYGGTSKTIEVNSSWGRGNTMPKYHEKQNDTFNLRMMIDNPAASIQFEAGTDGYWVGIYRASEHDMHEALALAHA